jgi:hypothetical protein
MDILQQIIQLVTILFLLSMVCERIADFLKHYLSDSQLLGIKQDFFKIGDTITKLSLTPINWNKFEKQFDCF